MGELKGDQFYVAKNISEQRGFYKLFIKTKGIAPEVLVECLDEYRDKFLSTEFDGMSKRMSKYYTVNRQKRYTLEHASYNMNEFLKIVSSRTGIEFTKGSSKQRRKRDSYDEWWQERNLDGSFAYNGVTDDF